LISFQQHSGWGILGVGCAKGKLRAKLIEEISEFRCRVGRVKGNLAAEFVREDRGRLK